MRRVTAEWTDKQGTLHRIGSYRHASGEDQDYHLGVGSVVVVDPVNARKKNPRRGQVFTIARPSLPAKQKKFYSGKKKRHTMKTQIITDKNGAVIAIETGHPGPKSDWDKSERYETVYQESLAAGQYPQAARRGDLGCLGVPKVLLPN